MLVILIVELVPSISIPPALAFNRNASATSSVEVIITEESVAVISMSSPAVTSAPVAEISIPPPDDKIVTASVASSDDEIFTDDPVAVISISSPAATSDPATVISIPPPVDETTTAETASLELAILISPVASRSTPIPPALILIPFVVPVASKFNIGATRVSVSALPDGL